MSYPKIIDATHDNLSHEDGCLIWCDTPDFSKEFLSLWDGGETTATLSQEFDFPEHIDRRALIVSRAPKRALAVAIEQGISPEEALRMVTDNMTSVLEFWRRNRRHVQLLNLDDVVQNPEDVVQKLDIAPQAERLQGFCEMCGTLRSQGVSPVAETLAEWVLFSDEKTRRLSQEFIAAASFSGAPLSNQSPVFVLEAFQALMNHGEQRALLENQIKIDTQQLQKALSENAALQTTVEEQEALVKSLQALQAQLSALRGTAIPLDFVAEDAASLIEEMNLFREQGRSTFTQLETLYRDFGMLENKYAELELELEQSRVQHDVAVEHLKGSQRDRLEQLEREYAKRLEAEKKEAQDRLLHETEMLDRKFSDEKHALMVQRDEANHLVDRFYNSKSYKVTAPLRWVRRMMGRGGV